MHSSESPPHLADERVFIEAGDGELPRYGDAVLMSGRERAGRCSVVGCQNRRELTFGIHGYSAAPVGNESPSVSRSEYVSPNP